MNSGEASGGRPEIETREVLGKSGLEAFISVPWAIYRDDDHWVPPLKVERRQAFSSKNPFFQHATWKAWTAWREGEAVGRISAQIDRYYLESHDAHTGFFGLVEGIDDPAVFTALFRQAENWLRSEGMRAAVGPFNLGINQEIGCLVEGFDSPPYVMMGHARPYYGARIEEQGYEKAKDVLAYEVTAEQFGLPEHIRTLLRRMGGQMRVRPVDRKNTLAELELMRSIFNDAWSDNWGFVPFSEEEFRAVGKELFTVVPHDLTWIAEVDGEPAAFIVLLPNINEAIADLDGRLLPWGWLRLIWRLKVRLPETGRVPLMGVRKKFQNTRLGPALAFLTIRALHGPAIQHGLKRGELSWILEDNQAMRNIIERIGGRVSKRYRMYRKELSPR